MDERKLSHSGFTQAIGEDSPEASVSVKGDLDSRIWRLLVLYRRRVLYKMTICRSTVNAVLVLVGGWGQGSSLALGSPFLLWHVGGSYYVGGAGVSCGS